MIPRGFQSAFVSWALALAALVGIGAGILIYTLPGWDIATWGQVIYAVLGGLVAATPLTALGLIVALLATSDERLERIERMVYDATIGDEGEEDEPVADG